MNILFVTDLYPIRSDERYTPFTLHNFVLEWVKTGNLVDVVKPNFVFNSFLRKKTFYRTKEYNYEGIKIYNLNYISPFFSDIEKKLPNSFDISKYEVIVAHMPSGIIWANKIAQKYKKPLICGVHTSDLKVLTEPVYSKYFSKNLKSAYSYAKKIACRSYVLQKKFCDILPENKLKTFVVPSGVDKDIIIDREISFHSPIRVITCGQFIKRKNIDKVIKAINELPDFELLVVGSGKLAKKFQKSSGKNIKFSGQISHTEVLKSMQKSDIFILPSVDETIGMVYLEALASGCVTVCAENEGISGIIENEKNGFTCEPTINGVKNVLTKISEWNSKGVKKAEFFNSPTLARIAENGTETVKKYTAQNCAKNYLVNLKTS